MKLTHCTLLLFILLGLAACAPDPRNQADADRTRALTAQDVADREQARLLELQARQSMAVERAAATARILRWTSTAGGAALAILIVSAALGGALGLVGAGKASARYANVRANLIPLDEGTRQFPLFLQYQGKGRYALANPNTGSVTMLDSRREPDRQMIRAMAAVVLYGAIGREARLSKDPAGVAIIQPPPKGGSDDDK